VGFQDAMHMTGLTMVPDDDDGGGDEEEEKKYCLEHRSFHFLFSSQIMKKILHS